MMVANVFHAGDGNLHPLVCYDGAVEGEAERAEELSGQILDACLDAGGSITGEHGVGVDKKQHMPKMFGEPDLDAFQRLRCAFDPAGLANPGKVMPTPRLCGEVPGPVPPASAGGRRPGGAVLMAAAPVATEHPESPEEAAELLRTLGEGGRPSASAAAARSAWAAAGEPVAVEIRTGGLDRILEHNVGDFTAVLEAGVPLAEAQERVRRDRPDARARPAAGEGDAATIGGVHRHGGLRARCATATAACATSSSAITVVLSRRHVAKAGGKVIKNVAGYDLGKLFAGSFGTLGLIGRRLRAAAPAPRRDRDRVGLERRPGRARRRRRDPRRAPARGRLPRRRLARRRRAGPRPLRRRGRRAPGRRRRRPSADGGARRRAGLGRRRGAVGGAARRPAFRRAAPC